MIDLSGLPLLPLIILMPFISIVPILLAGRRSSHNIQILSSGIVFALVIAAWYAWAGSQPLGFSIPYINGFNIDLSFQVSQLSIVMLVMTSVVFLAAAIVGRYFIREDERTYNIIFAVAQGASLALFLSANLFLFYVFWEVAEVMMFFIIFMYGGYGRKRAAIKFIVYSLASSLLLLIAIILLYSSITPHTFEIGSIISTAGSIAPGVQLAIILLFTLSFMIKMPIFPFHNWLPEAHTEAPTTGSMILAGVLLKFGGYGLLLMFLMLPLAAHYSSYMAVAFGFSAMYAALAALRQGNLKRAIAYTSITDMGIVAVGAAAFGILGSDGALYAMLSHGIVISLLFLVAGTLSELYGTLEIEKIKGVLKNFRALTYFFIFGAFGLVGIPLTAGFIGDILVFVAANQAFGLAGLAPLAALLVIGAMMFWLVERIFLSGKETHKYHEIDPRVIAGCAVLSAASILLGIMPFLLIGRL